MIPSHLQDFVADEELAARFVMTHSWVRADGTVRADAFVPPPSLELSVTRHVGLSERELWLRGVDVASQRDKLLVGRADIAAGKIRTESFSVLDIVAHPLPENPQHAHIIGWPEGKPQQKEIALHMARSAGFVRTPIPPESSRAPT